MYVPVSRPTLNGLISCLPRRAGAVPVWQPACRLPDVLGEISYEATVIPRSSVDVAADVYTGEFTFLHLQRHGPDTVRDLALDGGEVVFDAGSCSRDLAEPAKVLLSQPRHLRPDTNSVAPVVLLGLEVRFTSYSDGQSVGPSEQ